MVTRSAPLVATGIVAVIALGCATPMSPRTDAERVAEPAGVQGLPTPFTDPASAGTAKSFYPLALGNRWHHTRTATITYRTPDGLQQDLYRTTTTRELTCVETQGTGLSYFVETRSSDDGTQLWLRLRQDAQGLHESGLSLDVPPQCGPSKAPTVDRLPHAVESGLETWLATTASVPREAWRAAVRQLMAKRSRVLTAVAETGPAELTRLRYPLNIGQQWMIRDDAEFRVAARVESVELLNLPAGRLTGYRIRLTYPTRTPDLDVWQWYGNVGYLGMTVRAAVDVVDALGNVIGQAIYEERDVLDAYSLVSRRPRLSSPFAP